MKYRRIINMEMLSYDAVLLPNSVWSGFFEKDGRLGPVRGVCRMPLVLALRESKVRELGLDFKTLGVSDLLKIIKEKDLGLAIPSIAHSGAGNLFYMNMIYNLLGRTENITSEDLESSALRRELEPLLSRLRTGEDIEDWNYPYLDEEIDGMLGYGHYFTELNLELLEQGKDNLFLIYPLEGMLFDTATLYYIDRGIKIKDIIFNLIQCSHLNIENEVFADGYMGTPAELLHYPDKEVVLQALKMGESMEEPVKLSD